jgi:hypothetical protein
VISLLLFSLSGAVAFAPALASGTARRARFEPPNGQVYLGVSTHLITTGVDAWDRAAGVKTHPALYGRWTTPDGPFQPILDEVATRAGVTPIVHWNLPMDGGQITNGSRDAYIRTQVAAVKAYRKPVFVRLDWEMNAYWYTHWNLPAVTATQFIASWRHVVKLFANLTNVAFVWAPNIGEPSNEPMQRWYPGDGFVDWVGLDAYPQSEPASSLLGGRDNMNVFAQFAAAHHKPLMLAEWAPNLPHPDTPEPINLVFNWAAHYPRTVKALVYFDFVVGTRDFRLTSHPIGAAVFRKRTADHSHYLLSLDAAAPSTTTSTAPRSRGAPASPTQLIGIQSYTSVALSWRPSSNATSYAIQRDGDTVGNSNTTKYNDTGLANGVQHTWTVTARSPGGTSTPSAPFTITPGRWGTHDHPCTYGPNHKPCRYPSEGPAPQP